jgi:hypothetical protein
VANERADSTAWIHNFISGPNNLGGFLTRYFYLPHLISQPDLHELAGECRDSPNLSVPDLAEAAVCQAQAPLVIAAGRQALCLVGW